MSDPGLSGTRGIVRAAAGKAKFTLTRFEPEPALAPFVEHYWAIRYDLRGEAPYSQTVLSYPNVHLAFEQDDEGRAGLLYGVPRAPFVRTLRGAGRVLGVKFTAGGFYPYWRKDVSLLTGSTVPASVPFGEGADAWKYAVLEAGDDLAMKGQAEAVLLDRLPARDAMAELAADLVRDAMNDRDLIKVEQLCERSGLSIRQLQRLFRTYVGVSPKWVIQRFRLQEAADLLEQPDAPELAELAARLGYFDQAHFSKDFKAVLGQAPAAYRKSIGDEMAN